MNVDEYRELLKKEKQNKYHVAPKEARTWDGIVFASKAEMHRYRQLKLMERAGVIKDLKSQPKYMIIPGFKKNGVKYQATHYVADFSYYDVEKGLTVIEDVKAKVNPNNKKYKSRTDVYRIKKKLFELQNPRFTITEVEVDI
jgi:hypothetical protein